MKIGSILVCDDHLTWANKTCLPSVHNDPRFGPKHFSSSNGHSKYLTDLAYEIGLSNEMDVFKGAYCWTPGPSFETPSETTFIRPYGAGAFGMSTYPEIQTASKLGMESVTISMVTNLAAGMQENILLEDVLNCSRDHGHKVATLILKLVESIDTTREIHSNLR